MKNREYHIEIHSISRFIIAMIVILCSILFLINEYTPRIENRFISIVQFLAIFMTSFYLAYLIGKAKAKVIFTEEGYVHFWEKKFLLSREKDLNIPWNTIDNYVFQMDRTFDSFIINLKTKQRYKINRLNILPIKDDFQKLIKDFPRLSNEYRKGTIIDNDSSMISKGESIYASKSFKWIFYFMSVVFLILVLIKILNPESTTRWASLGVIGCALLFYGLMIKG